MKFSDQKSTTYDLLLLSLRFALWAIQVKLYVPLRKGRYGMHAHRLAPDFI